MLKVEKNRSITTFFLVCIILVCEKVRPSTIALLELYIGEEVLFLSIYCVCVVFYALHRVQVPSSAPSILAGAVSDNFAAKSHNSVKVRSFIMALGYVLSLVAAVVLPSAAEKGFAVLMLSACAMMFGASWSGGVFWALPVEVYSKDENVAGTAFCSGASNIPNPIAPAVVGVMLGAQGHWTLAWITCAVASGISLAASVMLMTQKKNDN